MAEEIRALSVRQPWAACITAGKSTENRTWSTGYRGLVAIHTSRKVDGDALQLSASREHMWRALAVDPMRAHVFGAALAVARLTDCHLEDHRGCCAPWGETGPGVWHWTLAEVRVLPKPVFCPGRLGLWPLPGDVLAAVVGQLAVTA